MAYQIICLFFSPDRCIYISEMVMKDQTITSQLHKWEKSMKYTIKYHLEGIVKSNKQGKEAALSYKGQ